MDTAHRDGIPCLAQTLSHLGRGEALGWHRHRHAYLAVVLSGTLEEVSENGRRRLTPGSVAIHDPFEAHGDRVGKHDVRVLNLRLPPGLAAFPSGVRLADPDALEQLHRTEPGAALDWLLPRLLTDPPPPPDWPDLLARDLCQDPGLNLGDWAEQRGLRRETLSRGFGKAFAITPKQFRASVRARKAWNSITASCQPLGTIAHGLGYADQAHMCRDITRMTGLPPGRWRGSTGFKTAAVSGA